MSVQVSFAKREHEEDLREILWQHNMDLSGEPEEHLIVLENGEVMAGSKLRESEPKRFYLELIGVKNGITGAGYGSLLLREMVKNPWKCCRRPLTAEEKGPFVITTIARGKAVNFYRKHGFTPCEFREIPIPFRDQCLDCLERETCGPVAMIMNGGLQE